MDRRLLNGPVKHACDACDACDALTLDRGTKTCSRVWSTARQEKGGDPRSCPRPGCAQAGRKALRPARRGAPAGEPGEPLVPRKEPLRARQAPLVENKNKNNTKLPLGVILFSLTKSINQRN